MEGLESFCEFQAKNEEEILFGSRVFVEKMR